MNNKAEENRLFNICKEEITLKFFGSKKGLFKHTDFVYLSEEIYEQSKISIGISTFKRIWKKDYTGLPNNSTLDALVKYLGYENWNIYRRRFNANESLQQIKEPFKKHFNKAYLNYYFAAFLSILVALICIFFYQFEKHKHQNIRFSYEPIKENTIPVTVAFHYNLIGVKCKKAQIMPLDRGDILDLNLKDTVITYTFQWASIFFPKLIIDGKVVKELKLELKTNGWKGAVAKITDKDYFIEYLNDSDIYSDGNLEITSDKLFKLGYNKGDYSTIYYGNHTDFPNIQGDSFHFETRIMNKQIEKNKYSGLLRLRLEFGDGEEFSIHIPVTILNDPPKAGIRIFDKIFEDQNNILTFLHINPLAWNTLEIISENKKVHLYINQKEVFSTEYSVKPSYLKGIEYIFNGMGKVDYLRFYDGNNKLVYNNEFN